MTFKMHKDSISCICRVCFYYSSKEFYNIIISNLSNHLFSKIYQISVSNKPYLSLKYIPIRAYIYLLLEHSHKGFFKIQWRKRNNVIYNHILLFGEFDNEFSFISEMVTRIEFMQNTNGIVQNGNNDFKKDKLYFK